MQSQLVQLLFKLLQSGPPLTRAHSVIREGEGGDTANVGLCNPVIRERGKKRSVALSGSEWLDSGFWKTECGFQ